MRKSADERREEILEIAVEHFAAGGYHGTSTEVIAREAGISQPYLFRLFRTKRELFLACGDRACEKVRETFRRAAAAHQPFLAPLGGERLLRGEHGRGSRARPREELASRRHTKHLNTRRRRTERWRCGRSEPS